MTGAKSKKPAASPAPPSRDSIAGQLAEGQLTLAQVEAALDAAGHPFGPPPDLFDPEKKARWSLPMVLAWIARRDRDTVRTFDAEYRADCQIAVPWDENDVGAGWHYVQGRPVSWTATCLELDAPEAVSELRRQLESGAICANAVRASDDTPIDIPASEWLRLEICDDARWRIYLRYKHAPESRVYWDVEVPRIQVIRTWEQHEPSKHRTAAQNKRDAEQWLLDEMKKHQEEPHMTKVESLAVMVKRYGIAPSRAKTIYQKCGKVHPVWSRAGRPKGSGNTIQKSSGMGCDIGLTATSNNLPK